MLELGDEVAGLLASVEVVAQHQNRIKWKCLLELREAGADLELRSSSRPGIADYGKLEGIRPAGKLCLGGSQKTDRGNQRCGPLHCHIISDRTSSRDWGSSADRNIDACIVEAGR